MSCLQKRNLNFIPIINFLKIKLTQKLQINKKYFVTFIESFFNIKSGKNFKISNKKPLRFLNASLCRSQSRKSSITPNINLEFAEIIPHKFNNRGIEEYVEKMKRKQIERKLKRQAIDCLFIFIFISLFYSHFYRYQVQKHAR